MYERMLQSAELDGDGPAESKEIEAAEQALGVTFPPQYRKLVARHRSATIKGQEIVGIPNRLSSEPCPNVVDLNIDERSDNGLPSTLLLFYARGDGDHYGFDLADIGPDGEPRIKAWPIGGVSVGEELEVISYDLGDLIEEWSRIDLSPMPTVYIDKPVRRKSRLP
jgi:hypothetical protein